MAAPTKSLLRQEVLPFVGQFMLMILAILAGDEILHLFDMVWVGRLLGIPGTLLIIFSLLYSLRKRKMITVGSPKALLNLHETLTWVGSFFVLLHAGLHFNTVLPWLATMFLVINVLSGMIGQRLLHRSRMHIKEMQAHHRLSGLNKQEVERKMFWDSVTFDLMAKWRVVHFPISFIFAMLTLGHIISIFLFWEWK
ncbi:MAG: hypothetical protein OEW37_11155 [Rhodospirillaceae bacterium]|nr:hypothetical protein [Rhodospirillaceae bacterium]